MQLAELPNFYCNTMVQDIHPTHDFKLLSVWWEVNFQGAELAQRKFKKCRSFERLGNKPFALSTVKCEGEKFS